MTDTDKLREINEYLKARVVALELTLEFYADEENWERGWEDYPRGHETDSLMDGDQGQRARKVLGMVKCQSTEL